MLVGSGSGLVFFRVTRLSDGLTSGDTIVTGDCVTYPFADGERMEIPFEKRGPITGNEEFMNSYYADPDTLTLPAGTWRIDVVTLASLNTCGGDQLNLPLSVNVTVEAQ